MVIHWVGFGLADFALSYCVVVGLEEQLSACFWRSDVYFM